MEPSSLIGLFIGWLMPGPGSLFSGSYFLTEWLNKRRLNNSIALNTKILEEMLLPEFHPGSIEIALSNCETYIAETLKSEELYLTANQLRSELANLENTLFETDLQGCTKEQTREFRKNLEDAKTLAVKYATALSKTVLEISAGSTNPEEIQVIARFVPLLESVYAARVLGNKNVHDYVKQFEEQNPNSDFCRQIKETRLQLQKRNVTLDEKVYLANLKERLEQHPPLFKPGEHFSAKYLDNPKHWRAGLKGDAVTGYSSQGPIIIESRPLTGAELSVEDLQKQLERNRYNKLYQALCFVVPEATAQELKIVGEFPANDCFTPFTYETETGRLTFNPDRPGQIYSHYFNPESEPLSLPEIMALYADTPHIATLLMDLPAKEVAKMKRASLVPASLHVNISKEKVREVVYTS